MSVVRGRPPGLAGGISGSSNRNCSSVRAWPEPKSPTSTRSADVHMAVSRQETARNAAREARISPSNRCPHPFANGVLGRTGEVARLPAGADLALLLLAALHDCDV